MSVLGTAAPVYTKALVAALRADRAIYLAALLYLILGSVYVLSQGGMLMGALDIYAHAGFLTYCLILPYLVSLLGIGRITHRLTRRRGLGYRYMFGPRRVGRFIAGTLLMLLVLLPFEAMFASIKSTISDGNFGYDKLAADVDKFIHFGHAPAFYIYSVAKIDWVLHVIEFNYDVAWFVICFGILYWIAISPRAEGIRLRYWASFFAVWIVVGNLAAGLLPTAGPAFYGLVTGDLSRFDKIRAFLDTTSGTFSSAADEQHYLWALHAQGLSGFGSGISAFPSMHVALIALNALFIGEYSRKLAAVAWGYVAVIMISSIYLGWHYGVDGYVALVMTVGIYWAVRRAARTAGQVLPSPVWRLPAAWRPNGNAVPEGAVGDR